MNLFRLVFLQYKMIKKKKMLEIKKVYNSNKNL